MAYPTGYTKYQEVTIDSSKVTADQTDFPIYVDLSNLDKTTDIFDTCRTDGGDIRVTKSDGTTQLPREVVAIDTTAKTGELHLKYTGTLSSSSDTVIRIYYNGTDTEPASDATYGSQNVWSGYEAVYHLQNLTSDSTGNSYTLTNNNTVTNTAVKMGNGADFGTSNTDKSLNINNDLGITGGTISITGWFRMNTEISTDAQRFFSQQDEGTRVSNFIGYLYNSGDRLLKWYRAKNYVGTDLVSYATTLGTDDIHYIGYIYDGTNIKGYLAGSEVASGTASGNGTTAGSDRFSIGVSQDPAEGTFTNYSSIDADEVRVSSTALSSTWIATEYNNQSSPSTFYSVGEEQGGGATFIPKMMMF